LAVLESICKNSAQTALEVDIVRFKVKKIFRISATTQFK